VVSIHAREASRAWRERERMEERSFQSETEIRS